MKKIIITLGVIIIGLVSYFGYHYYAETYVMNTEYALTKEIPAKESMKDMSGDVVPDIDAYNYSLNFYTTEGEKNFRTVTLKGEEVPPISANKYIKIDASKKRTSAPVEISVKDVPKKVLETLQEESYE